MWLAFFLLTSDILTPMNLNDLSEVHGQISNCFQSYAEGSCDVTDEQKEHFDTHGFVTGIKLLTSEQIAILRRDLNGLISADPTDPRFYEFNKNESTDRTKVLFHMLGAWRVSESFHDLVFFRPIASVAERLVGHPVRLWHDQLFVKPAREGGVVAWHQDYAYWTRTKPMAHITCWIALYDSTIENGCVHYIPGSHKWNLLPKTGLADNMMSVFEYLDEGQKAMFQPVPAELKAGEASFHHAMVLHGSYENRSHQMRGGAVINMFRDGVVSDTDEPLLQGVPIIQKGERIAGQYFPFISAIA